VKRTTGYSVELLIVDMASFASVSAFATTFKEKYDRLDVLILNAGVVQPTYEATVDGLDIKSVGCSSPSQTICVLIEIPVPK
jgi:NAD(P)-dependent dehydrogenase (short-subunit alcohol dehydrogenase family)